MWICRLKIKHDCIIGTRCRKFGVTTIGVPFSVYLEDGVTYSPQVHTIYGEDESVRNFIEDLRKDKRVTHLEYEGNTIFCIEVRKDKVPASYYNHKLLYVKPVFVDRKGYEYWEVTSWDRKIITRFVGDIQSRFKDVKVLKLRQSRITDIYFSHLGPRLTENQRKAILLAQEKGWYSWPRKTDLGELSKMMGVSIPTFREHLKRAEGKIMPELVRAVE
jgi:predicted DNA binding protein